MNSSEVRKVFLDYFESKGHALVASSSLVPANDPSLLFTNAGMVQFKDVFLGREERDYVRAASSQRCVRAGGKHNDLDNVGYTARHHTFFEMLGNFSFGEYFKREAIEFAWELLTQRFGLPEERLWVTVFETDDDAANIWLDHIGVAPQRFTRCGEKDNFWMMGETGPCGPCTEIFYDHGSEIPGGPPGTADADGDRYVEIWNLVFMQYERDAAGVLSPIPKPSVDTGMGLERLAAVLQGVHDNYEIDLFSNLINAIREISTRDELEDTSLRVIADHIRSCAFLIMDGVTPSNEGRGYVLRRIIRRALRHGNSLGFSEPFFYRLVGALDREMGFAFPELTERRKHIENVLEGEERRFAETLDQGLRILEQAVAALSGTTIPGGVAFQLYDTYGFPVDLTADIARERGLVVDMAGFERAMEEQRARARSASQFAHVDTSLAIPLDQRSRLGSEQKFSGYDRTSDEAGIVGIFADGQALDRLEAGDAAMIVLDVTPFYAESGGQIGDRGRLHTAHGVFEVEDTQKQGGTHLHIGRLESGKLALGDRVQAEAEDQRRELITCNHSATHLMHAALRAVLGTHVEQKGSLVEPERTRFDFSHPGPVTLEELQSVERLVNEQIRLNTVVKARVVPYKQAIENGAMALFGEKYGDEVRELQIGGFSVELCGGTHVTRTGGIGLFKIISESGVAAGIRRIEAITGEAALDHVLQTERTMRGLTDLLKGNTGELEQRVVQLLDRVKLQDKEIQSIKTRLAKQSGGDITESAVPVGGVKVLSKRIDGADMAVLRSTMDSLKDRLAEAAIVLAAVEGDKVRLVAGVTKSLSDVVHAGELVNFVAQQVDGKGGGRPDMAQAGGNDATKLDVALASVPGWVEERLARQS